MEGFIGFPRFPQKPHASGVPTAHFGWAPAHRSSEALSARSDRRSETLPEMPRVAARGEMSSWEERPGAAFREGVKSQSQTPTKGWIPD